MKFQHALLLSAIGELFSVFWLIYWVFGGNCGLCMLGTSIGIAANAIGVAFVKVASLKVEDKRF
jgi:hypothetical protein